MIAFFYFLIQSFFFVVFLLPSRLAIYIMRITSEIVFRIARLTPIKNTVAKNLSVFFPDLPNSELADKLLKNVSLAIFEIICTPFFKDSHIKQLGKIVGQNHLDLALAKRKGVLLLLMHAGNYELTHVLLAPYGYKINGILKAPHNDPLFKQLNRSRSYHGTKIINVLEVDMYKESIKALNNNEIVCLLIDTGALESRHETIEFLGKQVPVASGWLTLAQRSEAAVIPCFPKREGNQVVLTIDEPLFVYSDNRDKVKNRVKSFFENFIKGNPEQWGIFLTEFEVKRMVEGY